MGQDKLVEIDVDELLRAIHEEELTEFFLQTEAAAKLVDLLHEETGVSKAKLALLIKLLAPQCAKLAGRLAMWSGSKLSRAVWEWLLGQPWFLVVAAHLLKTARQIRTRLRAEEYAASKLSNDPISEDIRGALSLEVRAAIEVLGRTERLEKVLTDIAQAVRPDPPLYYPQVDATKTNRFSYAARYLQLVGRASELKSLQAFLRTEKRFSWWLIVGPGGQGKSRLALELALCEGVVWRCGFLPREIEFDWHTWQPEQPTLLIVDYVSQTPESVHKLAHALACRRDLVSPVRLLLLERSEQPYWFSRFTGVGSKRAVIEGAAHASALALTGLSDEAAWSIVEQTFARYGKQPPNDRTSVLNEIRDIDRERRPLFISLAADTLAVGRNIRRWDVSTLVRDVIDRDRTEFWDPAGITEGDINLLALSTMVGGLSVERLRAGGLPARFPNADQYNPKRIEAITGADGRSEIPPIAPDIIGSFFALNHLEPSHAADARAVEFRDLAWSINPSGFASFLVRTEADFPDHVSLSVIRDGFEPRDVYQARGWARLLAGRAYFRSLAGEIELAEKLMGELSAVARSASDKDLIDALAFGHFGQVIANLKTNPAESLRWLDSFIELWRGRRNDSDLTSAVSVTVATLVPFLMFAGARVNSARYVAALYELMSAGALSYTDELRWMTMSLIGLTHAQAGDWTVADREVRVLQKQLPKLCKALPAARKASEMVAMFFSVAAAQRDLHRAQYLLSVIKDDVSGQIADEEIRGYEFAAIALFLRNFWDRIGSGRIQVLARIAMDIWSGSNAVEAFVERFGGTGANMAELKIILSEMARRDWRHITEVKARVAARLACLPKP